MGRIGKIESFYAKLRQISYAKYGVIELHLWQMDCSSLCVQPSVSGPEGDFMRRKLQLLLLLLLIAGTTETGMRASTDCERWMAAYKVQLAHAKALKRMQAAHARVKRLAQKKLADYV